MAVKDKEEPKHRILREVFRHYLEFKSLFESDGTHVIEHGYWVDDGIDEPRKVNLSISLWDLQNGLKELSPRKREAVFYNVILDKKQKDVAEIMNITTVSVGQYVEQAMVQLSERYFADELSADEPVQVVV
jgi:DNA-directed RNA polymerase specialized sigma24 family protein